MEKSVQITLIVVGAVLILGLLGFYMFSGLSSAATVTGNGQAVVKVVPDLSVVYFNIDTEGKTATEAKDANAKIVDEVITALVKLRFDRDKIVTESFNIYPNYIWNNGENKIDGYKATHSLKLEISTEEVEKIGEAIDAGVNSGATVSYINFELSQESQNKYKAEALTAATEDARIKAEAIAQGLGKNLGKVVSISESSYNYYPWRAYGTVSNAGDVAMAEKAVTDIQPGEQEVSANVIVVYNLR